MVYMSANRFHSDTEREMSFVYDPTNDNDMKVINKMLQAVYDQPKCEKCKHSYFEGSFCGYEAMCCKIYGCIEYERSRDAGKCEHYTETVLQKGDFK